MKMNSSDSQCRHCDRPIPREPGPASKGRKLYCSVTCRLAAFEERRGPRPLRTDYHREYQRRRRLRRASQKEEK